MNKWLQLKQTNQNASHNLICLPFAGGFAEYFLSWRNLLPNNFQLCPIQLPGRSYRWEEKAYTEVDLLINDLINNLIEILDTKPYILFGHSMGGYLGYKLCEAIKKYRLREPELMVVSSVPAPLHWQKRRLLSEYSDAEFKKFFLELGGYHPELMKHKDFIETQMRIMRNDILLCESCTQSKALQFNFPLLALGGKEDNFVATSSIEAWQTETNGLFQFHAFEGEHFYLNSHLTPIFEKIMGFVE